MSLLAHRSVKVTSPLSDLQYCCIANLPFNKPVWKPSSASATLIYTLEDKADRKAMEMTNLFPFVQLQCLFQKSRSVDDSEYSPSFLEETYVAYKASRMKVVNILKTSINYPLNNFCGKI